MVFVSLFNELWDLFSGCVPEGEDVVNEPCFQTRGQLNRFANNWFKISVFTLAMKILAKATVILVAMAVPCIFIYICICR